MKYTNQALTRLSGRYSMEPITTSMAEQGLAAPQALFHSAARREVTPPSIAAGCYRCAKRHDAQPADRSVRYNAAV